MVEVTVEPSPLPYLRTGETIRIRIRLRGGKPGELVALEVLDATTMSNESSIVRMGHQALTYDPIVDIILRATQDGIPTIVVSSPKKRFESVIVNGHQILQPSPGDIILDQPSPGDIILDQLAKSLEEAPQKELEMPDKKAESTNFTIVKERKWWWKVFVGGLLITSFLLALCVVWFTYQNHADKTDQNPIATPDPVAQAEDPPEPVAQPESPAAPAATSTAPAADPTNCTFLNDNRPKVGDKYILQCAEGQFLATGTYNGENFDWSGFEAHTP